MSKPCKAVNHLSCLEIRHMGAMLFLYTYLYMYVCAYVFDTYVLDNMYPE